LQYSKFSHGSEGPVNSFGVFLALMYSTISYGSEGSLINM